MERVNRIKGYRSFLGLSQEKMGEKFGITKQSYNYKENGKTPFTDREKLIFRDMLQEIIPDITIDEIFF